MNAIDLLLEDHKRVKAILNQLSDSTERAVKKRTELLNKLEMEITIHTRLEEEILYPVFKKAGGKEQAVMYHEAKEEHRTVDSLVLPDLKKTAPILWNSPVGQRWSRSCSSTISKKRKPRCFPRPASCSARQCSRNWANRWRR